VFSHFWVVDQLIQDEFALRRFRQIIFSIKIDNQIFGIIAIVIAFSQIYLYFSIISSFMPSFDDFKFFLQAEQASGFNSKGNN